MGGLGWNFTVEQAEAMGWWPGDRGSFENQGWDQDCGMRW